MTTPTVPARLLATGEQFAARARLGRDLTPTEEETAQVLLGDVSAEVRAVTGQAWSDDGSTPPELVPFICAVVRRELLDPDGAVSQDHIGDLSVTTTVSGRPPVALLTDDERNWLQRYRTTSTGGLRTIGTTRNEYGGNAIYVNTDSPGADPIPMFDPADLP